MTAVKRFAATAFTLALVLVLAACDAIPVPPERLDYVGQWEGVGMSLTITADGGVTYERITGSGSRSVTGPIKAFDGDDFIVGVLFFKTTFEVSQPPYEEDGVWKMVVDGVELTRVRGASPSTGRNSEQEV